MHPYVLVTWDATVRTVHGYIEDNVVAIKISGLPPESMIRGVAAGMCYLHENGVVHGSIHGQNILISDTIPPQACLADYGVASVISNYSNLMHSYHHSMPAGRRLSHFLAPEHESVMDSFSKTEAGDVYAFSTATYQILTGRLPSPRHISMWCRSQAMRPVTRVHRDRGLDKPMQHILVNYWEQSLERRPSAREIVDMLEDMHARMREAQRSMCLGKVASSLGVILNNVEHYKHLLSCTKAQAQSAIDAFQTLLDTENFMGRTHLIAAMRRLSERTELYPSRFALNGPVPAADEVPAASGSYADIYKVNYLGEETCFKVIRVSQRTLVEHMAKVYAREIILWGQLSHPNILPFYGLSRFRTQLSFVSRWATNGNIGEYLARNPDANRILLCSDTAAGVEYLHKNDIVHGDLKGLNVLIDSSGHALLGDFGLASVTDPEILKWTAQATIASKGGTTRWQAPELHETEESVAGNIYNSKESDIFAWASLCYEASCPPIL
ncbi:hypothetical protein DXG01_008856 [Tephrocybe rancida]|nr:hypothetical protein DXG01_008856 [Tephrocybe rancida]